MKQKYFRGEKILSYKKVQNECLECGHKIKGYRYEIGLSKESIKRLEKKQIEKIKKMSISGVYPLEQFYNYMLIDKKELK